MINNPLAPRMRRPSSAILSCVALLAFEKHSSEARMVRHLAWAVSNCSQWLYSVCLQTCSHSPFDGAIHKITTRKEPFVGIVRFRAPLENGEFPIVHLAGVCEPAYRPQTTIIRTVQVTIPPLEAGLVITVGTTRFFSIKTVHDCLNLPLYLLRDRGWCLLFTTHKNCLLPV
jgi:hypothetical protein